MCVEATGDARRSALLPGLARWSWLLAVLVFAWAVGAPLAMAQRAFKKQRKYVAEHVIPPTSEIPVAPEGMLQADALEADAVQMVETSATPSTPQATAATTYAAPYVAPAYVPAPASVPTAPLYTSPTYAQPAAYTPPIYGTTAPPASPSYVAPYVAPAAPVQPSLAQPPPASTANVPPPVALTPAPVIGASSTPQVSRAQVVVPTPAARSAEPVLRVRTEQRTVVPSGPRYVLVPIPPEYRNRRDTLLMELGQVDARLSDLRREQQSIGGPIVQMVLGYGSALVFSTVALSCLGAAEGLERSHKSERDGLNANVRQGDEDALRHTSYVFTGLGAAGLLLGLGGTRRLMRHVDENRTLKAERSELLARRSSLRHELQYGASLSAGQIEARVRGRF